MFAGRGVIDSQAQTIQVEERQTDGGNAEIRYHPMLKARQETALVTVPEQGYIKIYNLSFFITAHDTFDITDSRSMQDACRILT